MQDSIHRSIVFAEAESILATAMGFSRSSGIHGPTRWFVSLSQCVFKPSGSTGTSFPHLALSMSSEGSSESVAKPMLDYLFSCATTTSNETTKFATILHNASAVAGSGRCASNASEEICSEWLACHAHAQHVLTGEVNVIHGTLMSALSVSSSTIFYFYLLVNYNL
jgi:hypothetical protein